MYTLFCETLLLELIFKLMYLCLHLCIYVTKDVIYHIQCFLTPQRRPLGTKNVYIFGKTIKLACHAHTMFFFVCEIKHYVVVR